MALTMKERIARAIGLQIQGKDLGHMAEDGSGDFVMTIQQVDLLDHVCKLASDAVLAELETPTDGMVEALVNEEQTPFIYRRKMDKSGYEVVEQKHPEWRTVNAEPMEVIAEFSNSDDALRLWVNLSAAWRFTAAIRAAREGK